MDQFSSVIPFWKPQNVSFLPRRGGPGPHGPPPPIAAPAGDTYVLPKVTLILEISQKVEEIKVRH